MSLGVAPASRVRPALLSSGPPVRAVLGLAFVVFGCADDGSQGGGPGLPSALQELCGQRPGSFDESQILRFENDDSTLVLQIERRYDAQGVGHSAIYSLQQWALVRDGKIHCVSDEASLSYDNTHHNWLDVARATIDQTRYELEIHFDLQGTSSRWRPKLTGFDVTSNQAVLGPLELITTGGPVMCWDCPGFVPVLISEFMADNRTTLADESAEYDGWIELYNPSASAVSLSGWSLSDDPSNRRKWSFSDTQIERHGLLIIFADGQPEQGAIHAPFELSPEGGALILTTADGTTNGGFAYGKQEPDTSFGYTFAASSYGPMSAPTPGQPNPEPD